MSQKLRTILPFWSYCLLLTWLVSDHCFFWDTVQLASKHAHWYYEQQFQSFFLPENINSGHPPLFGMYLAICWLLFGKTLLVSHFAVLPFLFGTVWQLYNIGSYFGKENKAKYLILLVLIDPFFAGQSVLVSPDLVLIFAFLLTLNGTLRNKSWAVILGAILLGLISMRGMMVAFALYLWWVLTIIFQQKWTSLQLADIAKILFNKFILFLPAGILSLVFLIAHYVEFGWIGYHTDSPWSGSFEKVGLNGFIRNVGILIWRYLDFGRLFLLGGLLWLFIKNYRYIFTEKSTQLIVLFGCLFFVLTPSLLIHKGLLSHRYLLPLTLTLTFLFYHLLFQNSKNPRFKQTIFTLAFFGLLTGNLWIYPKKIAQGWDATLAHLPYYRLRQKMIDYIDKAAIPYHEVGTVFPCIGAFEIYDLNGRKDGFVRKNFTKNNYFLYTTIFNDLSDEEFALLENNWRKIKRYEYLGLEIVLYKRI